ncbi:DASH family cryptochrome [Pedobacter sp. LMG 31464]|uniref:Cryptochrome DASH n=1 Tax=Pedobacter planticolens TaxID=2679964 RepID=A0A923E1Z2_9SPHI|nr:DASH family cryptochrome [Pedobacter planticolens]MBB2146765.1 DASH family cryptochrome [Pedobacter planticolens]
MSKRILVWFRNDLRLHDNEMLVEAIAKSDEILPVYCFDPRQFELTRYHSIKTGATRAQFLIESVAALRQSFQELGGDILILKGKPEEFLPDLVSQYELAEVYHHREVASEETAISTHVEDLLWKQRVNLKHFIGHTLYNKEDLPFPVKDIPDVFTQFKKKTERDAIVKPCFLTPDKIDFVSVADWGVLPELNELVVNEDLDGLAQNTDFKGGEQEAFKHLHDFLHTGEDMALANASLKKNEIVSKLSPWLALGCLSPREVYWKMKEAEANYGLKPYFYQIVLGLLWRDYYRFMFKKHGNTFFKPEGFAKDANVITLADSNLLHSWKTGNTGHPLVDAIMHELNATGYINSASRQLVATYLIYELKVNWVMGAAYLEEKLIDYCPASNWGNWATVAGVGNDQRLTTSFDFEKQLKIVDPKGVYAQSVRA